MLPPPNHHHHHLLQQQHQQQVIPGFYTTSPALSATSIPSISSATTALISKPSITPQLAQALRSASSISPNHPSPITSAKDSFPPKNYAPTTTTSSSIVGQAPSFGGAGMTGQSTQKSYPHYTFGNNSLPPIREPTGSFAAQSNQNQNNYNNNNNNEEETYNYQPSFRSPQIPFYSSSTSTTNTVAANPLEQKEDAGFLSPTFKNPDPSFVQSVVKHQSFNSGNLITNSSAPASGLPTKDSGQQRSISQTSSDQRNVSSNNNSGLGIVNRTYQQTKYDMQIEDKADVFLRIGDLERQLALKDRTIENTYKLAFLSNQGQGFDIKQVIESYVLLCAENEKLSFGFVDKLAKIDDINKELDAAITQRDNWKILYENKSTELSQTKAKLEASQTQQEKLRQKQEQESAYISGAKVSDLEAKLASVLAQNNDLNGMLSERVDEVNYLQVTIKEIQDTFSEKFTTDSRFQKIIKDLEAEIKRMDGKLEELICEKEVETSIRLGLEEENSKLRLNVQEKRQELEAIKMSAGANFAVESQLRKKQEQIDEMHDKIVRQQQNLAEIHADREQLSVEVATSKESFAKLQQRFESQHQENLQLLQKNSSLQARNATLLQAEQDNSKNIDLQQLVFEKESLSLQLQEVHSVKERLAIQVEQLRKQCDDSNKSLELTKQRAQAQERSLINEIEAIKQSSMKESETSRLRAKISVQEEMISTLKHKSVHAEDRLVEKQIEADELRLQLSEMSTKLQRQQLLETTLRNLDQKNEDLEQELSQTAPKIQRLSERVLMVSIENDRLHQVMMKLEEENGKAMEEKANFEPEMDRMEAEMKEERGQFQTVIQSLESQLSAKSKESAQYEEEFFALKRSFQQAVEAVQQRDQTIFVLENKYNEVVSGDHNMYVISKLEQKINALMAENQRLSQILLERVRSQHTGYTAW